jgi:hypothetical protein
MSHDSHQSSPSAQNERRREPRFFIPAEAWVVVGDERALKGKTIDISSAGVCLTLAEPIHPGQMYRLRLKIPPEADPLLVNGRVCFCITQHTGYRVGFHCSGLENLASRMSDSS